VRTRVIRVDDIRKVHVDAAVLQVWVLGALVDQLRQLLQTNLVGATTKHEQQRIDHVGFAWDVTGNNTSTEWMRMEKRAQLAPRRLAHIRPDQPLCAIALLLTGSIGSHDRGEILQHARCTESTLVSAIA